MKKEIKIASYRKYSTEWFFTECDKIWELIEVKFQYNKQFKDRINDKRRNYYRNR